VKLRCHDHVVIQRPEGAVREALVVVLDLLGGQRHWDESHPVFLERFELLVG
jgi:hypothetical protein